MRDFSVIKKAIASDRRLAPLLAIADQSVYALTNLAFQIIVARSVPADEFGAYTVGSTFFFVAALVHHTGIVEPMFVFSGQRYLARMAAYHERILWEWSFGFSAAVLIVGLCLALIFKFNGSQLLADCVWGFAMISPVLLYLWLLRRIAFFLGRIDIAVAGGLAYSVAALGMAAWIWRRGDMTAEIGIWLSGLAAVFASVVVMLLLRRSPARTEAPADMLIQHVRYGRWALGTETVGWLIGNGPIVLLPLWYGLAASAQYRIINLLFMPLAQLGSVMSMMLIRRFSTTKAADMSFATVARFFWMAFAGSGIYAVIAVIGGPFFVPLIFGGGYSVEAKLVALAASASACAVSAQSLFAALRSREQSHQVLLVLVTVLTIMTCLLPIVGAKGVFGILLAQAIAWGIALPLAAVLAARACSDPSRSSRGGQDAAAARLPPDPRLRAEPVRPLDPARSR